MTLLCTVCDLNCKMGQKVYLYVGSSLFSSYYTSMFHEYIPPSIWSTHGLKREK